LVAPARQQAIRSAAAFVELDGASQAVSDGKARVKLCQDRGVHAILVTLGPAPVR
jgi:hypothetical protein